jgi:Mg-chelatase subunit ChlI
VKKRPHLHEFMARVAAVFEVVVFTASQKVYAEKLLNVIDPKIGGVMVMGDRGTGKSTTIRALADLLPEMKVRTEKTMQQCLYRQSHCNVEAARLRNDSVFEERI